MSRVIVGRLGHRRTVGQISLVVAAVAAVALAHVHLHLMVIQAGYAIAHETRQRHDLEDQNQKLRLELAMRRDPAAIERHARDDLRLVPPDPSAIRVLSPGSDAAAAATDRAPRPTPPAEPAGAAP